jgi:hypothetical protein
LLQSKHVKDLRLIVTAALIVGLTVFVVGLVVSIESQIIENWHVLSGGDPSVWKRVRIVLAALGSLLTFLVPAVAGFGAICAWSYQIGSARLGVVDLFACEIATLCRVATTLDSVHRLIERIERGPPADECGSEAGPSMARPFVSEEDYFPVFNTNTKDLETLEARVVINITAFYTYMKALRDRMRALAAIKPQTTDFESPASHSDTELWLQTARDAIFLWFLGLESARRSIVDLVEFEPEQAERVIVVLISELEAYRFLCAQFSDEQDVHYGRLRLRAADYDRLVPALNELVKKGCADDQLVPETPARWLPASVLLPELRRRYNTITAERNAEGERCRVAKQDGVIEPILRKPLPASYFPAQN